MEMLTTYPTLLVYSAWGQSLNLEKLLERLQGAVTANKSMGQTVLHVNSEVLRVTRHTLTDDAWSLVRDRSRVVIPWYSTLGSTNQLKTNVFRHIDNFSNVTLNSFTSDFSVDWAGILYYKGVTCDRVVKLWIFVVSLILRFLPGTTSDFKAR